MVEHMSYTRCFCRTAVQEHFFFLLKDRPQWRRSHVQRIISFLSHNMSEAVDLQLTGGGCRLFRGNGTGGLPGPGPLRRLPPPPTLEIGTKVPDHRCQRRPKQILPDVAKGKKLCFHPMCQYSIYSEFSGEINNGQKWVFFQSAQNKYPTSEPSFSEMAATLVCGTLY